MYTSLKDRRGVQDSTRTNSVIQSDTRRCWKGTPFLGASADLRKATTGFVMSVYPSVHMEHLGSRWTDVREILNMDFLKCGDKIQFRLKSDKNMRHFTWWHKYKYFLTKFFPERIQNLRLETVEK